jgi:drug/metabolite transporter (DMT)-like permease
VRIAVEAVIAILLFGCIPVVVRAISANPYTIGIFRLGVATVILAAILAFRGELRRVSRRDLLRLALIGFVFFGHWITLFFAIKISSASIGAIGLSTYGIDLLLLGTLTGERARLTDVFAVLLAAAGAILVVPQFRLSNDVALGMLLACISALLYASLPLLHQRWSAIPTQMRTLGQFGFALLCFLFFVHRTAWSALTPRDWGGLLFLAIGVTLVAHSLWVRVTTHLPPSATSIIYYGNIPIAIVLSVALLGEPLTARTMSGAVLIIAGSAIGLTAKARRT